MVIIGIEFRVDLVLYAPTPGTVYKYFSPKSRLRQLKLNAGPLDLYFSIQYAPGPGVRVIYSVPNRPLIE